MNAFRFLRFLALTTLIISSALPTLHADNSREGFTHIECTLQLRTRRLHKKDDFHQTSKKDTYASFSHPHIPIKEGTSQNWSGYAAFLKKSAVNSVTAVYGSWIVPTLSAAPHNTWCSLWVGIDGYSSSSVEQIGTEHDWNNGSQQNYAWFEMYPGGSYEINGFPLNPGDLISTSVVYASKNTFVMTITNNTQKKFSVIPTSYTKSSTAQRSSAEWIMEAPYYRGILPLSHFNTAHFTNCTATINNIHGAINNPHWIDDQLIMITANGTPKAIPSQLSTNGQSFGVVWNHE